MVCESGMRELLILAQGNAAGTAPQKGSMIGGLMFFGSNVRQYSPRHILSARRNAADEPGAVLAAAA